MTKSTKSSHVYHLLCKKLVDWTWRFGFACSSIFSKRVKIRQQLESYTSEKIYLSIKQVIMLHVGVGLAAAEHVSAQDCSMRLQRWFS